MKPIELRRRMVLFMTELGRGDAMASLEQRTGSDGSLQAALQRFAERYAIGAALDETLAYGAYADAFADASKSNRGDGFSRNGKKLNCDPCGAGMMLSRDGVLAHVLLVTHIGRAEAARAR